MKKTLNLLAETAKMGFSREAALTLIDASLDAELGKRTALAEELISDELYDKILDGIKCETEENEFFKQELEEDLKKNELIRRIDRELEAEIMKTGATGSEGVLIKMILTAEEKELFSEIEKYDDEHYHYTFWGYEFESDKFELLLSFAEEI